MLYSDGPGTEASIDIDAPAEVVWDLVSDITLPARFSQELQSASWIARSEPIQPGDSFLGRNQNPHIGTWETTSIITDATPRRSFAWRIGDADAPSARWRFEIEDRGAEVTLTQSVRIGPGPSGLSPAIEAMPEKEERIVQRRLDDLRSNMEANLAGIKELARTAAA